MFRDKELNEKLLRTKRFVFFFLNICKNLLK